MKSAADSLVLPRQRRSPAAVLSGALSSPRAWVYVACAILAVVVSAALGKDMGWDTLDYHFYAGFSALHDRFGLDYFPAGSQTYFNPYVYVPFYLLARSRLPAIVDASILAIAQSGILWLTYEIALRVAPRQDQRTRITIGVCATLLALGNPILLNQFGSSYADILTSEVVLAGWLLLVVALQTPSARHVVVAGLLLGAASALKLTNSVHALSAGVLLLFIPVLWSGKLRYACLFGLAGALGFILVCLPWSIRLEQHFGNPLFPVLNGIFRSPQFPTARMLDYRFMPDSLANALLRPFQIVMPAYMVDDELQAPDVRYAVLLIGSILLALRWVWPRGGGARLEPAAAGAGSRALLALGCAFLADWVLWLTASGNGRYFMPGACIAGVLAVAVISRLCASSKLRAYALAAVLGAQLVQLYLGAGYRLHLPWDGGPWFEVTVPAGLPSAPALYLSYGVQSNSFIVPFLPRGSAFVNVAGDYPLGPDGANGAQVEALVGRFLPHLRVIAREERPLDKSLPAVSGVPAAADALMPFNLLPVASGCFSFEVANEGAQGLMFARQVRVGSPQTTHSRGIQVPQSANGFLETCRVVQHPSPLAALAPSKRDAEMAFGRLEGACPALFQPARPVTQYFGENEIDHSQIWARRYLNTGLTAWVSRGWVVYIDQVRGGPAQYIARESDLRDPHLSIACGRHDEWYFVKAARSSAGQTRE